MLSYGAWQRLFGGSPDVVGRSLVARNHAFTIAGVMPADFEYPRGVEIWTTLTALADDATDRGVPQPGCCATSSSLARLRPGVTLRSGGERAGGA